MSAPPPPATPPHKHGSDDRRHDDRRPALLDDFATVEIDENGHGGNAMRTIPSDYDDNQDRWLTTVSVSKRFGSGDVHRPTAERIVAENLRPVLDVGCGDGRLPQNLPTGW